MINKNYIIRLHNELVEGFLGHLSAKAMDVQLATIVHLIASDTNEVHIPFGELKACADYTGNNIRLVNTLKAIRREFLTQSITDDDDLDTIMLYSRFTIETDNRELVVRVNEDFSWMIRQVASHFTEIEPSIFVSLTSKHAKLIYVQLRKWKSIGKWDVDIDNFKRYCGLEKYSNNNIVNIMIPEVIEQLNKCFENLKVEKVYGTTQGRPLKRIVFTFEPIQKKLAYKETGHICPNCNQKLVEKEIKGRLCWCHTDGYKPDAKCNMIYNTIAEIYGYSEDNTIKTCDNVRTENPYAEENIEKINAIANDLFS